MEMLANSDIIVGAALDHHRSKPVACEMYGSGQTRRSAADDQNVVSRNGSRHHATRHFQGSLVLDELAASLVETHNAELRPEVDHVQVAVQVPTNDAWELLN